MLRIVLKTVKTQPIVNNQELDNICQHLCLGLLSVSLNQIASLIFHNANEFGGKHDRRIIKLASK